MSQLIKKHRIGPLPGKKECYVTTLIKCLEFIKENCPSKNGFQKWLQREFPSIKSEQVLKDRVNTVLDLGLTIKIRADRFTLSDAGRQFLNTQDKKILYKLLEILYTGFYEIVGLLHQKSRTLDEIRSFLTETGNEKWESKGQCRIRMTWMEALGYITINGHFFCLTEEGKSLIEKESENNAPTHSQIQDVIAEVGTLGGFISEKEYKVDGYSVDVVWKRREDGYPAYVFEVQIGGTLEQALLRLKDARNKFGNPDLRLVTDSKNMEYARSIVRNALPELAESITLMHWKEIYEFKETLHISKEKAKKTNFPLIIRLRRVVHLQISDMRI